MTERGLVLIVEDEKPISDLLRLYLQREGFGVHAEFDGPSGLSAARTKHPSAVVLDVGLPGMDGTEVCRQLREEGNWVPIVFCTARDDEVDRILGLEMGADDYVTKPFSPREVVARVKSLVRRAGLTRSDGEPLVSGRVRLDTIQRRAFVSDAEVTLTATEFDLLSRLMSEPGHVLSRDQLLAEVWGYASAVGTRTVDVHVAQLRAKLGDDSPIRTVRGVGYAARTESK
ncbi:MAG TPA: response regulator transcription factor [Candidatus Nanopelagicales bacterium]|nr:response regulator transcription factor [Candidatus Nanopelagicales bacterium]